jgi:hypothetical protein
MSVGSPLSSLQCSHYVWLLVLVLMRTTFETSKNGQGLKLDSDQTPSTFPVAGSYLGRAQSKISLRRAQFKRAMAGSDAMLIHLGRSVLGQNYKVDVNTPSVPRIVYLDRALNPRDADPAEAWHDDDPINGSLDSPFPVVELPFKDSERPVAATTNGKTEGATYG